MNGFAVVAVGTDLNLRMSLKNLGSARVSVSLLFVTDLSSSCMFCGLM